MRLEFEVMQDTIKKVFVKYGMSEERADLCARIHTESSRDGIFSHGTNRVMRFIDYVEKGWVDVCAEPSVVKEMGAIKVVDGNMGPGIVNAMYATDLAVEMAKEHGVGIVGLKNTTHWMRGGTYGLYAASKGYIGMMWTNTESIMPPWGGKTGKLGNNPFVMVIPGKDNPIQVDMAMSQYAYGKLQVTRLAGQKLPFPGGYDNDGVLTDDPGAIEVSRRILPMGYWKGSSFAFMLDILAAALSDGRSGKDIDKVGKGSCGGASQVFIVIDPKVTMEQEEMEKMIEDAVKHLKSTELCEDSRGVIYPGEDYVFNRKESAEKGVFVDDTVWEEIESLLHQN